MSGTLFRARYVKRGGHIHCALFAGKATSPTFAKCGDFTVREEEFEDLQYNMAGVKFYDGDDVEQKSLECETTPPDKVSAGEPSDIRKLARIAQGLWVSAEDDVDRWKLASDQRDVVIETIIANLRHGCAPNEIIQWFDGDGKRLLATADLPERSKP
jgi:hypothetical protein